MSQQQKQQPSDIIEPGVHDVLCGRGNNANNSQGNRYYRELVKALLFEYVHTKKKDRPQFMKLIVQHVGNLDPPGRFLKLDRKTNRWVDMGEAKAIKKVNQAFLDRAPNPMQLRSLGISPMQRAIEETTSRIIAQHVQHVYSQSSELEQTTPPQSVPPFPIFHNQYQNQYANPPHQPMPGFPHGFRYVPPSSPNATMIAQNTANSFNRSVPRSDLQIDNNGRRIEGFNHLGNEEEEGQEDFLPGENQVQENVQYECDDNMDTNSAVLKGVQQISMSNLPLRDLFREFRNPSDFDLSTSALSAELGIVNLDNRTSMNSIDGFNQEEEKQAQDHLPQYENMDPIGGGQRRSIQSSSGSIMSMTYLSQRKSIRSSDSMSLTSFILRDLENSFQDMENLNNWASMNFDNSIDQATANCDNGAYYERNQRLSFTSTNLQDLGNS